MRFASFLRRRLLVGIILLMTVSLMAAISYGPPSFVTTALGPASLAVADFNGDGKLDFASANWNAGPGLEISLRFGDGAGAFPTGSSFAGPALPHNIAAADMDNDADIDLVITTNQTFTPGSKHAVVVMLNDGAGTFTIAPPALQSCMPPPQETVCDGPSSVAVADLNEDGDNDIIVTSANFGRPLFIYLANGSGGFNAAAYPTLPVGTNAAFDVVAADFNGDDHVDLGLALNTPGPVQSGVAWMLGKPNGTFAAATVFTFPNTLNGEHGAVAITAGDVDHDGDIDTATVAGNVLHGASVFLNNGTGTAAGMTWTRFSMPQAPANPVDVVLADLDGDSNVDILTVDQFGIPPWGDNLAARPGNGDGTFGAAVAISAGYTNGLESHWNPRGIAAVDLNCDGKADLIAGHEAKEYVSVMMAPGAGSCADAPPTITAPPDITLNASSCPVHIDDADLGTATATDDGGPPTVVRSGVPAGNNFPLGVTTITYTATDGTGHIATATQTVTVVDTTPPTITAPANVSVIAGPSCRATLDPGTPTVSDGCGIATATGVRSDGQPLLSSYPIGTTTILWTADDGNGNSAAATQTVTVAAPPPVISGAGASPASLWPPNHKTIDVTIDYTVSGACGAVTCVISSITSSEPANGLGDGDTAPDWQIVDDHHVRLRAERAGGGGGRVYTVTISCTDTYGHTTTKTVTVAVPHN